MSACVHRTVAHPIVVGEINLPVTGRGESFAKVDLHGQTIFCSKFGGKNVIEVPAEGPAYGADRLGGNRQDIKQLFC